MLTQAAEAGYRAMAYAFRSEATDDPLFGGAALVATSSGLTNGTAGILVAAKSAGTASGGRAKTPVLGSYGPAAEIAISPIHKTKRPPPALLSRIGRHLRPCGRGRPCLDRL